ncbi:unnamed protein product [Blepharisma stoltei]|uniref:Acid phosphatase n=1 Tax=Blepharisma stoltei TaxID=1481888 RepID=A0AAU9J9Z5_9CILI|nr:unnamed protein product [Blepharisma stoltei]
MALSLFLSLPVLIYCSTIFVVEVSRHGARTPLTYFPWDTADGRWSPYPEGELTPEGMRQHYLLGYEFRNRYIINTRLLNETFYQPEINVYSTDVDRTLQSAVSQLLGLYPPGTGPNLRLPELEETAVPPIEVYNETEIIQELGQSALPNHTQVIPVHTDSLSREILLVASEDCPRYDYLMDLRNNATDVQELIEENASLLTTIATYFKVSASEAGNIFPGLVDNLRVNNWYGYTVPTEFQGNFFTQANSFANQLNQLTAYTPDLLARYAGSAFLSTLSYLLNNAQKEASDLRYQFYSAHDTTILNILSALQLPNGQQPPFASTLIFELIQDDANPTVYNVTLAYNDVLQTVGNCPSTSCPLETFLEFINARAFPNITASCMMNYDTVNWGSLTKPSTKSSSSDDDFFESLDWYWWVVISVGFVVVISAIIAVIVYCIKKNKKSSSTYERMDFINEKMDFKSPK